MAVLLVNALDIFGDDHLNTGAHLSIRRLLAARPFASPLSAYRADKAAILDVITPDGEDAAALQPQIGDFAEGLVEIEAVVCRSDLVSRDVVAQLGIVRRVLPVPRQIFARQLPLDHCGIRSEERRVGKECRESASTAYTANT